MLVGRTLVYPLRTGSKSTLKDSPHATLRDLGHGNSTIRFLETSSKASGQAAPSKQRARRRQKHRRKRSSVRARSTATLNMESNDIGTPHRCIHATNWSTSLASGGTSASEGTTEARGGAVVALAPSILAAAAAAAAMEAAISAPGDGRTPASSVCEVDSVVPMTRHRKKRAPSGSEMMRCREGIGFGGWDETGDRCAAERVTSSTAEGRDDEDAEQCSQGRGDL